MDPYLSELPANSVRFVVIGSIYMLLILLGVGIDVALIIRYCNKPLNMKKLTFRLYGRAWDTFSIGLLLVLIFTVFLFLQLTNSFTDFNGDIPGAIIQTGLLYISILLFVRSYLRQNGRTWTEAFGLSARQAPVNLGLAPIYYLATLPAILWLTLIYQFILRTVGFDVGLQEIAKLFTQPHPLHYRLMLTGLAVIAAPFFEELVFRGIFFPYLAHRIGLPGSITAVSALFALVHFHLPMAIPLFLLSVAFCLAYWRTGSLWVCIGMHTIFNSISIAALSVLQ